MKMASGDGWLRVRFPSIVFLAVLLTVIPNMGHTQDAVITNAVQLAAVLNQSGVSLSLAEPGMFWPTLDIFWADFGQLTNAIGDVRSHRGQPQFGVTVFPIRMTRTAMSTTMAHPWDGTELLELPAPENDDFSTRYSATLSAFCVAVGKSPPCEDDPYVQGYLLDPARLVLDVWLGDVADYSTYQSNVMAMAAADAECATNGTSDADSSGEMLTRRSGMMLMDEDSCTITNEDDLFTIIGIEWATNGYTTVTWQSCSDHIYGVFSADELSMSTVWIGRAGMWGDDGSTSWTDTNAASTLTSQFYKVVRIPPNEGFNGDVIPSGWAVDNGLNPVDSSLDSEDPDGDGYVNLEEYLNGTDPNSANTLPGFVINGGNLRIHGLNISVQPTSTNYPKFLVWGDLLASNITVFANTGSTVTNAVADEGDGVYGIYAQYADAGGNPTSPVFVQSVTLDRQPPIVSITAPTSNAVLDQAFITLEATVSDPGAMLPNTTAQLSIWINNQPYWDRAGTNIVVERFPVPAGTNSFTVTIRAVDEAGNTNTASRTWTVDPSGDTTAPVLSSFNIATNTLLPDVSTVWVEGAVDDSNALVHVIVSSNNGNITTNLLNVFGLQFEGLVPLKSGTNQVAFVASDAAGNASSNLFALIRSNRYRFQITSPAFGAFATTRFNFVSGYVSPLFDEGLPTQTNVTSVFINGVAAVLGTNVDANGNLSFTTTNAIPLGDPITGFLAGPGIPTNPPPDPPTMSQEFQVTYKEDGSETIGAGESDPFDLQWIVASNCWLTAIGRDLSTVRETTITTGVHVDISGESDQLLPMCLTTLNPDGITNWYSPSGPFTFPTSRTTPIVPVLSFGIRSYVHGAGKERDQVLDPDGPSSGACRSLHVSYDLRALSRERETGWMKFRAPRQDDTNTTVILTFEGMEYGWPDGTPLDLSQIKFHGQTPVAYSNETGSVSYLLTVDGGKEYTLNQDDFQWPAASVPGHYASSFINDDPCLFVKSFSRVGNYVTDMHWLQWTDFQIHKPVRIKWNGADITDTSTNSIVVGQKVSLQAVLDPSGIAASNFTWSVGGSAISNYVVAGDSSSAQVLPLTQTNNATVNFYWVSSGQQNISCTVILTNGQTATSKADFSVQRPPLRALTGQIIGSVAADANFVPLLGTTTLHFGTAFTTDGAGIISSFDMASSLPLGFSNEWVQVVVGSTLVVTRTNGTCFQVNDSGLDQKYPFDTYPTGPVAVDAPANTFDAATTQLIRTDTYTIYLMLKPPDRGDGTSWVPWGLVSWTWSGASVFTNSSWSLVAGSAAILATDNNTTNYPTWTHIATGGTVSEATCPP